MTSFNSHFELLLTTIEPPSERLAIAQSIPADVREYLKQHEDIITVAPHSRLAGSYARYTTICNIKDVDVLIMIHEDYLAEKPSFVLATLNRVLKGLPEALGTTGEVNIRHQRRSIHVNFVDWDFHLDIVPVAMPGGIHKPLRVPDREWEEWCDTHPLGYQAWLSELNNAHIGKVIPLVKLVKYWKECQFTYKRPKSYWLECLVVQHIKRGWVETTNSSYAEVFANLLLSIHERFEKYLDGSDDVPHIPDPMLTNNVAWNWERSHFEGFMARIKESHGWAQRALSMRSDQTAEAVALWQKVFNNTFPTADQVRANQYGHARKSGSVFVTPQGRVLTKVPAAVPVVQSREHRFFGDGGES